MTKRPSRKSYIGTLRAQLWWESLLARARAIFTTPLSATKLLVAGGLFGLLVGWWLLAPLWTAHQVTEAVAEGEASTLEVHASVDTITTRFYQDWASRMAQEPEERRLPRALSLSVQPEAVEHIRESLERVLEATRQGEETVLTALEISISPRMRFLIPGKRDVKVTLTHDDGGQRQGWLRLERSGLRWRVVHVPGALEIIEFALGGGSAEEGANDQRH